MDNELLSKFIDKFQKSVYNLRSIDKNPEFFTLTAFTNTGEQKNLISKVERTEPRNMKKRIVTLVNLHNQNNNIKAITIELFNSNNRSINIEKFVFASEPEVATRQSSPLDGLNGEEIQSFISSKVQAELERKEREDKFNKMIVELDELRKLKDENAKQIEELEDENETLLGKIELKNTISASAGVVGSLLESLGIPREVVGAKLGGLMGVSAEAINEAAELKRQEENGNNGSDTVQTPEEQAIESINEYLYNLDRQQLSEVFIIIGVMSDYPEVKQQLLNIAQNYIPQN